MDVKNIATELLELPGITQKTLEQSLKSIGVDCTQATISRIRSGEIGDPKSSIAFGLITLHKQLVKQIPPSVTEATG